MEIFRKIILGTMLLAMAGVLVLLGVKGPGILRDMQRAMSLPAFSSFQHVRGAAARLEDGRFLIVGDCLGDHPKNAEIYDPAMNTWESCSQMLGPRKFHCFAATMPDGRVLVAGGSRDVGADVLDVEAFDPRRGTWSVVARLPEGTRISDLAPLPDGRLLVATGEGESSGLLCLDPASSTWSQVGHPAMVVNGSARLTLLRDGKVLVTHLTYGEPDQTHTDAFLFDPRTRRASMLPAMSQGRQSHEATLMKDGRVLVTGGADGEPSAEIYDPAQSRFIATGPMVSPRCLHAAVELGDGRVLIVGGVSSARTGPLPDPDHVSRMTLEELRKSMPKALPLKAQAECYDPASNTFTQVPDPPSPIQVDHGDLYETEPDGRALLMSLHGPVYFDPSTNAWQFPHQSAKGTGP